MFGKSIDNQEIKKIRLELENLKNQIKTIFRDFDMILMPTTPQNPFNINDTPPVNQANLTSLANIADLPAISLPYKHGGKRFHSLQIIAAQQNDLFLLKTFRIFKFFEKIFFSAVSFQQNVFSSQLIFSEAYRSINFFSRFRNNGIAVINAFVLAHKAAQPFGKFARAIFEQGIIQNFIRLHCIDGQRHDQ